MKTILREGEAPNRIKCGKCWNDSVFSYMKIVKEDGLAVFYRCPKCKNMVRCLK